MKTIKKQICLPVNRIIVTLYEDENGDLSGVVTSDLRNCIDSADPLPIRAAIDAIESLVLAHACAHVDIESERYVEGLDTTLDAIFNRWG